MKKLSTILLALIALTTCFSASAYVISAQEALKLAQQFNPGDATTRASWNTGDELTLGYTNVDSISGNPCYYIFNRDNNAGFVIIAADTKLPTVLGYSSNGNIDFKKLPANIRWWFEEYGKQVSAFYAAGSPEPEKKLTRADREPIPYLVQSTWNQGDPYNRECPKDNGKLSYTGCVATSTGQVVRYLKYFKGAGSHSNIFWPNNHFTFDGASFDWSLMPDKLTTSNSQAEIAEVNKLMVALGAALDMQYGADASGAYSFSVPYNLYKYFGYSIESTYIERDYYSDEEWEDIIYGELTQKRPVIYSGSSTSGGHSFICDGYQGEKYFHINWGWGGSCDGYYLLDNLAPKEHGAGGSGLPYNSRQGAILHLTQPAQGQQPYIYMQVENGEFDYRFVNGDETKTEFYFNPTGQYDAYIRSWWGEPRTMQMGLEMRSIDGEKLIQYIGSLNSNNQDNWIKVNGYTIKNDNGKPGVSTGVVRQYQVTIPPDNLEEGYYRIYPAARWQGYDWQRVRVPINQNVHYLIVKVKDGKTIVMTPDEYRNETAVKPTKIEINPAAVSIKPGDKYMPNVVFTPENTDDNYKSLMWTSNNTKVATVDPWSGEITGIAEGEAVITGSNWSSGLSATCTVTVSKTASSSTTLTDGLIVTAADGVITIEGIPADVTAEVFAIDGTRIAAGKGGASMSVTVDRKGVFVVVVGKERVKVTL